MWIGVGMPGGRPAKDVQRHEVFEPLAEWFDESLTAAGHTSINGFLTANRMLNKHLVYNLANAARPLKLDEIRMIALALKRPLEEAETLWRETRNNVERRAHEDRRTEALASWDDLPGLLDPSVQDLMEAQCDTVEQLPYRKLLVEPPPLSTVYVRQQVRHEDANDRRPTSETVTALGALDRHEHLLITGGPGTGKSTFGHFVTGLLAKRWLRLADTDPAVSEPVLPLRIPARALLGDGSWSEVLANAVDKTLALNLTERCPPALLTNRAHGARWLMIVDGLDEITDSEARARLVTAIARHSRGGSFRFVVSTRDLPESELAPLRNQRFGNYSMVPMSRPDLTDFAEKWFTAQNPDNGKAQAQRFLHQAADGRLRELVRNPLLATIAAVAHYREPERPLPSNRAELYERFYDYLVDERYSGRPATSGWLHERREELIAHLGRARLEGERPLLETAMEWVGRNGSAEEVRDALISTGLFVHEAGDIRFLHHSFAEYLSAKGIAVTLTADSEEMRSLLWQWDHSPGTHNHVLLTLSLWARRSGDIDDFVTTSLWRLPELTGSLIAEGVPLGGEIVEQTVQRLGIIALANDQEFTTLVAMSENQIAAAYLASIAALGEIPAASRVRAAIALCYVQGLPATQELLDKLLVDAPAAHRLEIGRVMLELASSDQRQDAIDLLQEISGLGSETALEVLALFDDYDLNDEAAALVETLQPATGVSSNYIETVSRLWLAVHGSDRLSDLLALPTDAFARILLATVLADHGLRAESLKLVEKVLADPLADGVDVGLATKVRHRVTPGLDETEVLELLHRFMPGWELAALADYLDGLGFATLVNAHLESLLDLPTASKMAGRLVSGWLRAHGMDSAKDLSSKLRAHQHPESLVAFATAFAESGCREQAMRLVSHVKDALSNAGNPVLAELARAWDLATRGRAREEISGWLADAQRPRTTLIYLDRSELAAAAARKALSDPATSDFARAAATLVAVHGVPGVQEALDLLADSDAVTDILVGMGTELVGLGYLVPARDILGLLVRETTADPPQVIELAYRLVRVGALDAVAADLTALLDDPTLPQERRVITRATLAWLKLLRPSDPAHSEAAPHP